MKMSHLLFPTVHLKEAGCKYIIGVLVIQVSEPFLNNLQMPILIAAQWQLSSDPSSQIAQFWRTRFWKTRSCWKLQKKFKMNPFRARFHLPRLKLIVSLKVSKKIRQRWSAKSQTCLQLQRHGERLSKAQLWKTAKGHGMKTHPWQSKVYR